MQKKKTYLRYILLFHVILFIGLITGMIGDGFSPTRSVAFARATDPTCKPAAKPDSQSLLVVLLDRSGSLTVQPGATDPDGYSASVTKAFADLWPGEMVVVAFSNNTTSILNGGVTQLANPAQRQSLRDAIDNYPIAGNTPLDPAMQEALKLLKGAKAGSRMVLITDGVPDPVKMPGASLSQEDDIRQNLLPAFCEQGIPISPIGLTIKSGSDPDLLLKDIGGGTYQDVQKPEQLADAVIPLYAEWRDLTFVRSTADQNDDYPIPIDRFTTEADIVTFHADNFGVQLTGPDGKPLSSGVQTSTDRHYEIDRLIAQPIIAGSYSVFVDHDPDARVYILIDSPLQIKILEPTAQGIYHAGQPIPIKAEFVDPNEQTPGPGQAQMDGTATFQVGGQSAQPDPVTPAQANGSPFFVTQTKKYSQPGDLQIDLKGNYLGAVREARVTIILLPPIIPPPPPKPCSGVECVPGGIPTLILVVILLAALIGFWIWIRRPKPTGWICGEKDEAKKVNLNRFGKAVIRSGEIQLRGNFDFGLASFELEFNKKRQAFIRRTKGNPATIEIETHGERKDLNSVPIELQYGDIIAIEGGEDVSYQSTPKVTSLW